MPYHTRAERWAVLVAHRRAGKTVAAINDTLEKATYNPRPDPRYAYIAPMFRQAKDIAWQYLTRYAAPFQPKISESELSVVLQAFPNRPKITLYGADNPDAFRGMYFDGVVLDEFGNMKLSVWKEVLLPALADRRGWATFMGTPNGPNHFRDMHYDAQTNAEWHSSFLPATQVQKQGKTYPGTGVIALEELAMMRRIMDEEQYQQEMLCNFEASVRGAIYARQIEEIENEGRVTDFSHLIQKDQQEHVVLDLGFRDDTCGIFWQDKPDGTLITHAMSAHLRPISFYLAYIKDRWKTRRPGQIWLPHDARARSLQTGISIVQQFRRAKFRPKIVPELDLMDGIQATRLAMRGMYFHEPETKDLVMALKSYHRKYDEDKKVYTDEPVHDWSSHYADDTRYLALASQRSVKNHPPRPKEEDDISPEDRIKYDFCLNDIWSTRRQIHGRV
ncbi:MAG: terminase family protein [Vicinamibacterales bacterium]